VNDITLKLDRRTAEGKQVAKLRRNGLVPSVVYGGQAEAISTQSLLSETTKAIQEVGEQTPLNLVINGKKSLAIIKNIDIDPVHHVIRHVAFHTIKRNDVITTDVPIELVGLSESAAERAGLVVLQAIESIEVKAKPADLPKSIKLDVTSLATIEDKLTIGDIKLPENVGFADIDQDKELVVVNVYEPGALQAANEAAGGAEEAEAETAEVAPAEAPAAANGEPKPAANSENRK
jgi:large subunit ribosomal protein L25